jgi:PAT family beta-lactamase induction signal transducer AmpG
VEQGERDDEGGASGDKKEVSPHFWVASTYFGEGFPYAVVHNVADVLFVELGASLGTVGLTSLFHLPWNLKFLWGPFLDAFGTKRGWLLATEIAIAAVLVVLAFASVGPAALATASVAFAIIALLSATHDIAVDGYYLEALDTDGQSKFVGYRAAAYRLAMLAVSGPILIFAGLAGWLVGLLAVAAVMGLLLAFHAWALPKVEVQQRGISELFTASVGLRVVLATTALAGVVLGLRFAAGTGPGQRAMAQAVEWMPWTTSVGVGGWLGLGLLVGLSLLLALQRPLRAWMGRHRDSFYLRAFTDFLDQPRVGLLLAFVILFRTGESFLMKMRYPLLKDLGMTLEQYGFANGTLGLLASIAGTMLGGALIARHSLERWVWPFVLLQNCLNLLFMGLAFWGDATASVPLWAMTGVIAVEAFGAGLGTAVLMVYIMRCCRPAYKAAHMAILTALMSLSFTIAGVSSGYLAEAIGFGWYFGVSFVATVPAMALIPFIPHLARRAARAL